MINPLDRKIILEPTDLEFERDGVLNPATYYENGLTHLLYRAVAPGNYSSIGYAILRGDTVVYRATEPVLVPETAAESHGIEDPRLVKMKGKYYLFYTAYDGRDAQVCYAVADELPHFRKGGIMSPPYTYGEISRMQHAGSLGGLLPLTDKPHDDLLWDKDAFIFPEHINGKMAMIHRLVPDIQLMYFTSFEQLDRRYWSRHLPNIEVRTLLSRKLPFESAYIGGGAPPIRTEAGWLFIYHAVQYWETGKIYRAAAALLDLENPLKVIGRLPYPLFEPSEPWEMNGVTGNVVFPTGTTVTGDLLNIYYGAADSRIGRITFNLPDLITELLTTRHA